MLLLVSIFYDSVPLFLRWEKKLLLTRIFTNGDKYILESHESGPEIIIYLALATASATLLKSIIDLINTILSGLSNEHRKQPPRIKISKRQIIKGNIEEENLLEIDIPISKGMEKYIEEKIRQAINKKP